MTQEEINEVLKAGRFSKTPYKTSLVQELQELELSVERLQFENKRLREAGEVLHAQNRELQAELESHAWEVSPAMAQAKIDELNAEHARLAAENREWSKLVDSIIDNCSVSECHVVRRNQLGLEPSSALADLLAPTMVVLSCMEDYMGGSTRVSFDGIAFGVDQVRQERARLNAIVKGEKKA